MLGPTRNWFGISAEDAGKTQELFLLTWLIVISLLTLGPLLLVLLATANWAPTPCRRQPGESPSRWARR